MDSSESGHREGAQDFGILSGGLQCLALSSAANEKSKTRLVLNSGLHKILRVVSREMPLFGTEFEKSVSCGSC